MASLLSASIAAELAAASLTYDEVGETASEILPGGYHHVDDSVVFPVADFDRAVERLMTWQVHEAAGLSVSASSTRIREGDVVEMHLGPRWLGIRALCRVVSVIDEPDRVGFAYGTLPGHAEIGEESFIVERAAGGAHFTIRAFSKAGTPLARLGGPINRRAQAAITRRYLRAIAP